MNSAVEVSKMLRDEIWAHVLPSRLEVEQAAFLYASVAGDRFHVNAWEPVLAEDFTIQTSSHIELSDAVRARVIKRAHDLNASLVEIHSHLGPWAAQFSSSDLAGFEEWVPHVRWRLKGRPYGAFVVTRLNFDGLAWIEDTPIALDLTIDGEIHSPTGLSRQEYYEQSI